MKKNIAIVSLKSKFCKNTCKMFCDKLEMMYADINDILQYNMINQNMLDLAGKDYFDAEEQKVLKSVVECENVCLNVDFEVLNKNDNLNVVKNNCLLIYFRFSKEQLQKINKSLPKQHTKLLLAYDIEDKLCADVCDIVINSTLNTKKDTNNLIESIKKYYNLDR